MPPYSAAPVEVLRFPAGRVEADQVAIEEPLEIRIGGTPVAVPAAFRRRALPVIERRLATGELAPHATQDELETVEVDIAPDLLVNVNTTDELRSLG